jgi:hypothetical protein
MYRADIITAGDIMVVGIAVAITGGMLADIRVGFLF